MKFFIYSYYSIYKLNNFSPDPIKISNVFLCISIALLPIGIKFILCFDLISLCKKIRKKFFSVILPGIYMKWFPAELILSSVYMQD